jgi:hypothetical protein
VLDLLIPTAGYHLLHWAGPMATKGDPLRAVAYERAWHHSPELRAIHRQLTAGIGLAMVAYAVIRVLIGWNPSMTAYRYACCRSQRMAIAPQIGGR